MPVKRSRRSRKFGTNKGSTQGKMNQFKRSFGRSFVSYFPGPTSSNTHLLGALLLVFILRVGMKGFNKENIEQQIKNSEYGALLNLSFDTVIEMISKLGNMSGILHL